MVSRIYTGLLTHTRTRPARHSFTYPTYMLGLDLNDLHRLEHDIPWFGYNRSRICSIWDRDYLYPQDGSIVFKLRRLLDRAGCKSEVAAIYLLTMPRVLRMGFNPVNIFWCLDPSGCAGTVVAEVRNTYHEAQPYVLCEAHRILSAGKRAYYRFPKQLFVSPFNGVEGTYDLRLGMPEEELRIDIDLVCGGSPVVRASLRLRGVPLTSATLLRSVCRYPLAAAATLPRIVHQAAVLRFVKHLRPRLKPKPASPMAVTLTGPESKWFYRGASNERGS
jgi:DUF1365 family protein